MSTTGESRGAPTASEPPGPIARVPRPKTDARDWYDRLSGWYDVLVDPFESPARTVGVEVLDASPGERVLDVGCGTGTALVALARAVDGGEDEDGLAVGVDIAAGMCRATSQALEAAGLDAGTVVASDGASLPFGDDSFNALFASFVLELFDTPEIPTVLAEWRRVLSPGGRLCVVALSRRGDGPIAALYETVHDRAPTAVDCRPIYVRETLREAGFRLVDTRRERLWGVPVDVVLGRVPSSTDRRRGTVATDSSAP